MIEWTEQATRQLDQAHDYIALSNSEEVVSRITMQIVSSVQQLAVYPMWEEQAGFVGPVSWSIRIRRSSLRMPSRKPISWSSRSTTALSIGRRAFKRSLAVFLSGACYVRWGVVQSLISSNAG